jgi:tight adherence protein C
MNMLVNTQWMLLTLVFLAVAGGMLGLTSWLTRNETVRRRLQGLDSLRTPPSTGQIGQAQWSARVVKLAGPMAKLSIPSEGWENSNLRLRFMQAGLRHAAWPLVFFASKTGLALALPGLLMVYSGLSQTALDFNQGLLWLVALVSIGYYLPNVVLAHRVAQRRDSLEAALPDALDLMIVCVEAGLGLDAAMNRAGSEVGFRSRALSQELKLLSLELRLGVQRERALRNLALRTGVDDVAAFVAMLVQADRFGTHVADALRIQADTMRTQRRLRAEERAAKLPLKMLFPMIFFIFPALMVVLMGPAMINFYRVLLPTMGAGR